MGQVLPFSLRCDSTSLAATTASGTRVAFPTTGSQVRLYNAGSVIVFVKIGTVAVAAAVTDLPIAPGNTEVFTLPYSADTHISGITASGTATLYVTTGEGE